MEKYQLLFENERDAIILVDVETQRFLEVNKTAVDLYGYSREEFLKMKTIDISAEPEKTDFRIKEVAHQSAEGFPVFRHKKKNETVFPVELSACSFIWKNRKTSCEILRDVTERKQGRRSGRKRRFA